MYISPRVSKIIRILCEKSNYITIESIARQLEVSSRTILRELDDVEQWLKVNGYKLDKKKGTGIRLKVDEKQKKHILEILESQKVEKVFLAEERQPLILSELLLNAKIIKMYYFAHIFDITEGTVRSDLEKVEEWLEKFSLRIVKKRGLGIYVEGEEKDIRRACKALIYEYIDESYILNFIRSNIRQTVKVMDHTEPTIQDKILGFMDLNTIKWLDELITEIQKQLGYQLADDAYCALLVHMAIAIRRIKNHGKITFEYKILQQIKATKEFKIVSELVHSLGSKLSIEFSEPEIIDITMHVKGCGGKDTLFGTESSMIEDFKLIKMAKEMIRIAEIGLGYYLEQNEKLLVGLVRHLGPAINRMKMNLDIRNPLLQEIKKSYPQLFKVAGECAKVMEKYEAIHVPEEEIAYIAMHFGAAMEHRKKERSAIHHRIVVACSSGIGASRMLSSRIEKEFPYIHIVDCISTLNIDSEMLKSRDVELIVSTVPIPQCSLPVVVVNPLFNEKNKEELEKFLANRQENQNGTYFKQKTMSLKEKLEILNIYNRKIIQVLDHFRLLRDVSIKNVDEAIAFVTSQVVEGEQARKMLIDDLIHREKQGSTLLEQKEIMLLHCLSAAVDSLYFWIIRPNNIFYIKDLDGNNKPVAIISVMLAPKKTEQEGLDVLSEITKELMENSRFTYLIREKLEHEIYGELSEILERFYLQKSLNIN
ncbi:BglG family transcription antiterminator [Defluviitalea raffinosedens]|uniref:BglG family transcription antiterminator n=1 Tax=Defluviitalea raffinosedens TaxID=1450156 RepID=UPI001957126B|nr:BglG family transcription antiterminator [Defluviitalea raffinosedens]MBM7686014.1 mannitol operon transcriptional antiterminator [Defluviitalea raffinosedens]